MGVTGLVKLARVASLEQGAAPGRERGPEVADGQDAAVVLAPNRVDPAQAPLHLFAADMVSRLAVEGGTVLDVGCANGAMAMVLARSRPDLRVVGADSGRRGVLAGRELVQAAGLGEQVELRADDVTDLAAPPKQIDVICCSMVLHDHDGEAARRCLTGLAALRKRHGCAVWVMDLARLRRPESMEAILDVELDVPASRRAAALAREDAAWTFDELRIMLGTSGLRDLQGATERAVGFLQAWWAPRRDDVVVDHGPLWHNQRVKRRAAMAAARMRAAIPDLPE